MPETHRAVPLIRSLSAKLLVLTLGFVLIGEALIYVPSVSRFRTEYLRDRIAAAQLASLALVATSDLQLTDELEQDLLNRAEILAVMIKRAEARSLILGARESLPTDIAASFDLREADFFSGIASAFVTMLTPGRTIRVTGAALESPEAVVEVVLDESALRAELFRYSGRILLLSLAISIMSGALVFMTLHWLIGRPLRRLADSMIAFRRAPEDETAPDDLGERRDELGLAQRELTAMQSDLRAALKQRARLAELGMAVSKINHDLRNILATAQLVVDRLELSGDPNVRRTAPILVSTIDRAIELCTRTLQFGRADEPPPARAPLDLHQLVRDVGEALRAGRDTAPAWDNAVPAGLPVSADRSQLFRVLMNLGRNAFEALEGRGDGRVIVAAAALAQSVVIAVTDNGPGLPEAARDNLFTAFRSSARSAETGLGLAIARDLARGHGGDLVLHRSDPSGTTFRIEIPSNVQEMRQPRSKRVAAAERP
jgi:signal transduction histidine kinase